MQTHVFIDVINLNEDNAAGFGALHESRSQISVIEILKSLTHIFCGRPRCIFLSNEIENITVWRWKGSWYISVIKYINSIHLEWHNTRLDSINLDCNSQYKMKLFLMLKSNRMK